MTLAELVTEHRVLLCVGSGGVGKTTTAAAIAAGAARRGRTTAVLTVDPAQRLKDTLGLHAPSATPHRVALGSMPGRLDALLLDVKATFDDLVRALASSPELAERILANRLYHNLSGTLTGTAEYMAVEALYRLVAEPDYDLLVVDTPPASHAVDFLDAPRRLLALLDSRAFGILKDPTTLLGDAGSRLAHLVLSGVLRGLERFTGLGLVREIGEFVQMIEGLVDGLRERVAAVSALLRSHQTRLVLVAAPEPRLADETAALVAALERIHLGIHGVIVNRALPSRLFGPQVAPAALSGLSAGLDRRLRQTWDDLRALAAHQAIVLQPLLAAARAPVLAEVPLLAQPPVSVDDLLGLGEHLFPRLDAPPTPVRERQR